MPRKRSKPPAGFRSKFEKEVADKLKSLDVIYEYEKIKVPYTLEKKYVSDFSFDDILLEVKGYMRQADITKMKALKKQHPHLRIIFLFQAPDKPMMGSKTTHAEWAEKNGFEWTTIHELSNVVTKPKRRRKSKNSQSS